MVADQIHQLFGADEPLLDESMMLVEDEQQAAAGCCLPDLRYVMAHPHRYRQQNEVFRSFRVRQNCFTTVANIAAPNRRWLQHDDSAASPTNLAGKSVIGRIGSYSPCWWHNAIVVLYLWAALKWISQKKHRLDIFCNQQAIEELVFGYSTFRTTPHRRQNRRTFRAG